MLDKTSTNWVTPLNSTFLRFWNSCQNFFLVKMEMWNEHSGRKGRLSIGRLGKNLAWASFLYTEKSNKIQWNQPTNDPFLLPDRQPPQRCTTGKTAGSRHSCLGLCGLCSTVTYILGTVWRARRTLNSHTHHGTLACPSGWASKLNWTWDFISQGGHVWHMPGDPLHGGWKRVDLSLFLPLWNAFRNGLRLLLLWPFKVKKSIYSHILSCKIDIKYNFRLICN